MSSTTSAEATAPEVTDDRTLGQKVGSGLRWGLAQQGLARAVSFASGIALARLLVPEDFGTFAVALTVTNVLFGLNDLGLLLAVVRWDGDVRVAARTALTLATGMSIVLYVVCFLAAPWYADVMGAPDATWVLRLLLVTLVLDGVSTVNHGLLIRNFRQDRIAHAEFLAMPVGVALTVGLAASGAGAWSFAIGQVIANSVTVALMIRWSPFRPRPGLDRDVARGMLRFGLPLAGASLVEYALLNADYVIVGRALGPITLGFYLLAYNLSNWPSSLITEAVRKVSFVGFHELSGDRPRLDAAFRRSFVILVTLAIPLVLCLSLLAGPLITVVYGEAWHASAGALRFLALLGGARVAIAFAFDLLVGVGRSSAAFRLKIVWCLALIPALELGVRLDDLRGVAVGHAAVALVVALPLFLHATRHVGVTVPAVLADLRRPIVGAATGALAGVLALTFVEGDVAQVIVVGTAIVIGYCAVAVRPSSVRAWRSPADAPAVQGVTG